MNMENLADHIISVAQNNHTSISNLQLQKVMYFVLKEAIKEELFTKEELKDIYSEPFLVWAYGPVVESQYNRFKGFGSSPIIGTFKKNVNLDVLNSLILKYLEMNIFDLVNQSHEVVFWKQNKNEINGFRSNIQYKLGDL
ncbi:hypothetical protein JavanS54_0007 [Streptococcus satellite phage Javan54]|uniref:Panacea domain-containing protein n=1 Tax=Streptococcus agalactiae TaxID=1311 RepID=UPI000332D99A|nr:type II toxin-antitoxin system antitoxin SocA domain-containing protein [Streptococcus agalactiae]QBX11064.1 hypothetical protein JavanS54_0007 [Streptococcus satellite phage Javan54]CCW41047.1 hypothetical protein MSA_21930 [Streptococcus agalactiae ILRI005]